MPIVGRIAAGVPIEAIESGENCFYVPKMLTRGADSFVLEIKENAEVQERFYGMAKKSSDLEVKFKQRETQCVSY